MAFSVPGESPKISAIVCTWNRAALLKESLRCLIHQTLAASLYEVIVVDNSSTDDTPTVVKEAALISDRTIRYVYEPLLGLSQARNRGLKEAKGEILFFTDDDCMANPGCLKNLMQAYQDPAVMGVAGRVMTVFSEGVVEQMGLPEDLLKTLFFHGFDMGEGPATLPAGVSPIGACISFRKLLVSQIGEFRLDLGLKGDFLGEGEETEWCRRFFAQGLVFRYAPGVRVDHLIPADRLTRKYQRKAAFERGQTRFKRKYGTGLTGPKRVFLFVYFSLALGWIALFLAITSVHRTARFKLTSKLWDRLGLLYAVRFL